MSTIKTEKLRIERILRDKGHVFGKWEYSPLRSGETSKSRIRLFCSVCHVEVEMDINGDDNYRPANFYKGHTASFYRSHPKYLEHVIIQCPYSKQKTLGGL